MKALKSFTKGKPDQTRGRWPPDLKRAFQQITANPAPVCAAESLDRAPDFMHIQCPARLIAR
jgi:hypothetical protein